MEWTMVIDHSNINAAYLAWLHSIHLQYNQSVVYPQFRKRGFLAVNLLFLTKKKIFLLSQQGCQFLKTSDELII